MSQEPTIFDSAMKQILEAERGVAGRSRWDKDARMDSNLSWLCLVLSASISIYMFMSTSSSIEIGGEVSTWDARIYSAAMAMAWLATSWVVLVSVVKRTKKVVWTSKILPLDIPLPWFGSTALLGIVSSFIMLFLIEWLFDILVITMRWDIIWANRVSVLIGPNLSLIHI